MVSSTFRDLKAEREGMRDVIQGQGMLARMMETDSAIPNRGLLTNSRAMVQQAELYLLLVSNYRYGQVIEDAELNPKGLSITEREFEWAEERGLPMFVFLLEEDVSPTGTPTQLAKDLVDLPKLQAFRKRARHHGRTSATFRTVAELREKATKALSDWRLEQPPTQGTVGIASDRPDAPFLHPPDRCLGRDTEIADLIATLTAPRPGAVVVLGGPGIGKTTLTRAVAAHPDLAPRFAERRWFVPLETATDAASLRTAVVLALGGNPVDPAAFDHALATLGSAPALLVLDNLETPYHADTAATRDTLRRLIGVPSVSLLCSYRGHTAPAAPAFPHQPVVPPLPDDAARRLFLDLAPRIKPDDPHLAPFLHALGGVPLAIELVALRAAPHDTLEELWGDWRRLGVELAKDPDLPEDRLTSLLCSIELSWRSTRLHDEGRRLFRLLGALPAGMAREDRAALLGDDATEAARQLLAIGLAVSSDGRLDLLPPIRDAARRLAPATEAETDQWCRHYLGLLAELGPRVGGTGGAEAVARLALEVANLDTAFAASLAERRPIALAAADGLCGLMRFTGLGRPAALQDLAASCHAACDLAGEARCRFAAGVVASARSDHDAARAAFEQALPLYRQVGDVLGEANCIACLGDIALARSDHDAARASYEQALPLYRLVGDVLGEANCIACLGDIALARSQHDAARAAYEQALPLYRQVGAVQGEANCIQGLGDIALRRSDHAAARASYEQALPLYRQVGAVQGEANCIMRLGDIALRRSDHAAARAAYEQALPLFRQVGAVQGEANCIKSLGDIALARSDHDAARASYEQALPLYRQVGDVQGEATCIACLGNIALARSDHAAARASYEQALPLYRQVGDVQGEANCIFSLGNIALARSDHAAARASWHQALALYARIPEPYSIGWTHHSLARIAAGAERAAHIEAARQAWTSIDRLDLLPHLDNLD